MIVIIFFWFGLSVAVGMWATRYDRSAGWFLTALVIARVMPTPQKHDFCLKLTQREAFH